LTLKWAAEMRVGLSDALLKITSAPARLLGIPAGTLAPGRVADVCVFDPAAHWVVGPRTLRSQGRNTPFLGLEVPGRVRHTLVNGVVASVSPLTSDAE